MTIDVVVQSDADDLASIRLDVGQDQGPVCLYDLADIVQCTGTFRVKSDASMWRQEPQRALGDEAPAWMDGQDDAPRPVQMRYGL